MSDLEYFINGINKDSRKLARSIRKKSIREIPVTLKDYILDAKDSVVSYVMAKKDDRAFQKASREDYKKYLSMHDERKLDQIDVFKFKNGNSVVVYTDQGPIIRTEEFGKKPDNMKFVSELQSRLGLFDRKITYEGFCYADIKGVPQVIYAQVTNTMYDGLKQDGLNDEALFDPGVCLFQGYRRLPNGRFESIDQEFLAGQGSEQMYAALESVFTHKYQQLHAESSANSQKTNTIQDDNSDYQEDEMDDFEESMGDEE